jgi:hypothetical protein
MADWPSSTSLTLDELMSSPIIGGCLRPSSASRKLTEGMLPHRMAAKDHAGLLRSYFNASSKAFVHKEKPASDRVRVVICPTPQTAFETTSNSAPWLPFSRHPRLAPGDAFL